MTSKILSIHIFKKKLPNTWKYFLTASNLQYEAFYKGGLNVHTVHFVLESKQFVNFKLLFIFKQSKY